jgi:hypothetical protein
MKTFSMLAIGLIIAFSQNLFANETKKANRSISSTNIEKPLQVRGQTRNLNMMLVVNNEKDRINFVQMRTEYKKEVSDTEY